MRKSIFRQKLSKRGIQEEPPEEEMGIPPRPPEQAKETKTISLMEKLKDLDNKIDSITGLKEVEDSFKKKSFKVPYKVKSQLKKGLLKNKIQVIMLCMNKTLLTTVGEFKLGQLTIGDKVWVGEDDIIWNWNGKMPTAIVPEWDLVPLTRGSLIKECGDAKRFSAPADIIIRKMAASDALASDKKKISTQMIIWILVIGAGAAWILFGGGG